MILEMVNRMEINWKDFGLMYVISFVALFLTFIIMTIGEGLFFAITKDYSNTFFGIFVQIVYLLATLLPASAFYVLRNKCDLKTMSIVGAGFGISFWVIIFLGLFLIRGLYVSSAPSLLQ